jgi:hypothetical protein
MERCQCDPTCKHRPKKSKTFCVQHTRKKNRCARKSPLSGYEPHYDPDFFNKPGAVNLRESHNCYAYAIGHVDPSAKRDSSFIQPGYAAGYSRFGNRPPGASSEHTCADIASRLKGDMPSIIGPVSFTDRCPPKTSKIALVVDPSADYHYYRQDSNGWWSHKPGGTPVTNLDAAGARIWDPALAARNYGDKKSPLNYRAMCGYFCVHRDHKPRVSGGLRRSRRKSRKSRKSRKR